MLLVPEDLCAQIRACIVKEVDWDEQVDSERWVRALTPQPKGEAVALDATIMEELRRGWAARDENERLRAERESFREHLEVLVAERDAARSLIDLLRAPMCSVCAGTGTPVSGLPCVCGGTGREGDEIMGLRRLVHETEAERDRLRAELDRRRECEPRAVIMDGSSRREVMVPLIDALVRVRGSLRAEPAGDSARIAALYAERGPLVDRELSGEITSDETARLRQLEGAIDRLERREELQRRISVLAAAFVDERAVKAAAAKMHEITNCLCGADGHAYEAEQVLAAACKAVLGGKEGT